MSEVNILGVWSADPADIFTPKPVFVSSEPFAIVIEVNLDVDPPFFSNSLTATWIMGTPRIDPYTTSWYTVLDGGDASLMPTVVFDWDFSWDYRKRGKNFVVWISFDHYSDAVSQILGGEKFDGLFYVMGTIESRGEYYFGVSDKYWYRAIPAS
ncbi:MAG TPA: hypothetical protein VHV29_02580 [Terriglobales bacterium]|jgi:hypothetical protein|nr:hypothetical protein [Terriglobales bacterium]